MARFKAGCVGGIIVIWLCVGCTPRAKLVVGSKQFSEQFLLCEILRQHLRARLDVSVDCKSFGETKDVHDALLNGDVDLYVEYVGTALTDILHDYSSSKLTQPLAVTQALAKVQELYRVKGWSVQWIAPLGFEDSFVLVIRDEDAASLHVSTLSDAAAQKTKAHEGWVLGVGPEFIYRVDGLEQLLKVYDLPLSRPVETLDIDTLYKALSEKRVDMVVVNSTDGVLSIQSGGSATTPDGPADLPVSPKIVHSVELKDDKSFFPPYYAAIVARSDSLRRYPGLRGSLLELENRISNDTMKCLNREVVVKKTLIESSQAQHEAERKEAADFLSDVGLDKTMTRPSSMQQHLTGCSVPAMLVAH